MKKNELLEQSQLLASKTDSLCDSLSYNKGLHNTLFQLKKSSSSVTANIREAQYPQSLADMLSKLQIARKECIESEGWLQLLYDNNNIDTEMFKTFRNGFGRIRRMLTASCITIESKIK